MNSCGQVFYIAKDPETYAKLIRTKTTDGEARAVFTEEELGSAMIHLRDFDKEDRVAWMREVCTIKKSLAPATVEKIGSPKEFVAEDSYLPEIKTKEEIARQVENARRFKERREQGEPSRKAAKGKAERTGDDSKSQREIFG